MNKHKKLLQEVQQLRHELAVVIPQEIRSAVELGDISQNTEYLDVLEKQRMLELRLTNLLQRVKEYETIDLSLIKPGVIDYGSTFTVVDHESNTTKCFSMVLSDIEDEPLVCDEITINSPMGKAFRYKTINEKIHVNLPRRTATYTILTISTIHDLK